MFLDLNDSDSIVTWWQVFPEHHSSYLEYKLRASPEFAAAIKEAQRRIATSGALQGALTDAVRERQLREVRAAEREGRVSSQELRYRELAAAA